MFTSYSMIMTHAKTQLFNIELQTCAEMAKTFSHPARLAILRFLSGKKTCMSGDISDELPLSRTTVSQHLQELKKAGLIRGAVDGIRINYCLDPEKIREARKTLEDFMASIDSDNSICC